MSNYVVEIKNVFANALKQVTDISAKLFAEANDQRKRMLTLMGEMTETKDAINALSECYEEAAAVLGTEAEHGYDVVGKIYDAIESPMDFLPVVNYEDFYGFCPTCGGIVMTEEDLLIDADGDVTCTNCTPDAEADGPNSEIA